MNVWQDEEYKLHHEIIPGVLEKTWEPIEKKLEIVKPFARRVHVDILDGKFADNTTFLDPRPFKKYSKDFFFELHMMVDDPLQYVLPFADCGFKRFIGHIEKMPDIAAFIAQTQLVGEVGLALDRETPLEKIPINLDDIDCLLVMTIKAGFSGQSFIPDTLEKVSSAHKKAPQLPIEVDGGITNETILRARERGATRFITTSFLFSAADPGKQYQLLHDLVV